MLCGRWLRGLQRYGGGCAESMKKGYRTCSRPTRGSGHGPVARVTFPLPGREPRCRCMAILLDHLGGDGANMRSAVLPFILGSMWGYQRHSGRRRRPGTNANRSHERCPQARTHRIRSLPRSCRRWRGKNESPSERHAAGARARTGPRHGPGDSDRLSQDRWRARGEPARAGSRPGAADTRSALGQSSEQALPRGSSESVSAQYICS